MHLLADFDYHESCFAGRLRARPEASDDAAYDATTDEEGEAPANPEISDCAISRQINSVLIT